MFEIKVNVNLTADERLLAAVLTIAKAVGSEKPIWVPKPKEVKDDTALLPPVDSHESGVIEKQEEPGSDTTEEYPLEMLFNLTEQELMEKPTGLLLEGIKWAGIDISQYPGKNTNAKLRKIILDRGNGPEDEVDSNYNTGNSEKTKEDASEKTQVETSDEAVPDRVEFRSYMVPRIQSKDPAVKKAAIDVIKNSGFASVDELYQKGSSADILRVKREILKIKY